MKKRIRYFADLSPGTGYSNAARGYVKALETLGYTPEYLHIIPAISGYSAVEPADSLYPYLLGAGAFVDNRRELPQEDINIAHVGPGLVGNYWTKGRFNVAITAWETNRLPVAKSTPPCMPGVEPMTPAEALNLFDQVWVPSMHCRGVFEASGVQADKLRVVPHCLTDDRQPVPRRDIRDDWSGPVPVRFYYLGTWDTRKNPAGLLRAYFSTPWNIYTPVSLFLHGLPASREPGILEANDYLIRSEIDVLRTALPDERRVTLPTYIPSTQYRPASWIQQAHGHGDVFVTASRGEGFGASLGSLEALAAGNLVLGGGGPAAEEFKAALGDLSGTMLRLLPRLEVPITPMPEMLGYELDQMWWETRLADLTRGLLETYEELQKPRGWPTLRLEAAKRVWEYYRPSAVAEPMEVCLLEA